MGRGLSRPLVLLVDLLRWLMVIDSLVDQLFIRLHTGRTTLNMALTAGKVQADFREGNRTIFVKLLYLIWIDRHQVRANITGKHLGITRGALGDPRHMTVDTFRDDRMDL